MTSRDHDRIADLFVKACELEGDERQAFLDRACAGDDRLRAEVESLLSYDKTGPPHEPMADPTDLPTAASVELRPGTVFADRFTIIERVIEAGMGVIYKAVDNTLDCEVALKLIRPALSYLPSVLERFRREARVTHLITHPNICRVHDIGNAGGTLFLSMEWVEGETLQRLLRQAGTLKEARALEIAEKVANALEAAHGKGIFHRDLKPGNIMVDRLGEVRVMDFGLAREQGAESVTGGHVLGTPMYMSPEQRRGEKLDARTDLYSLGLILREMLTGRRPEYGQPLIPEDLSREINPLIIPLLERLLAENREERYDSAGAVRRDLRELLVNPDISRQTMESLPPVRKPASRLPWIVVGVVLLPVVAFLVYWAISDGRSDEPPLSQAAYGLYMAGDRYLRESSETIHGIDDAIQFFNRALAQEEGSALVLARLGEAYWFRYKQDRNPETREKAQSAVADAFAIDASLPEVHNAMAMGLTADGKYVQAKAQLEQALEARPDYALAWANLGIVHRDLGNYAEGLEACERAIEHEPDSCRMYLYLGVFYDKFEEHDKAAAEYRKAIEWKPDSRIAWSNLASALLKNGQYDQAIEPLQRSIEMHDNGAARSNLGTAYYALERFDEAIEQFRRATELEPRHVIYWINLGETLVFLGRVDEAREPYRRAAELARETVLLEPLRPQARADLALYCAYAHDAECAVSNALRAVELQQSSAELKRVAAVVHALLGRDAECLQWLEQAVEFGISRAQIDATPEFERLRDDPRFQAIVALAS